MTTKRGFRVVGMLVVGTLVVGLAGLVIELGGGLTVGLAVGLAVGMGTGMGILGNRQPSRQLVCASAGVRGRGAR